MATDAASAEGGRMKLPITPSAINRLAYDLQKTLDSLRVIQAKLCEVACEHCGGDGWVYDNPLTSATHECSVCKGTGFKKKDEQ